MNDETWVESKKPNLEVEKILKSGGVLVLNEGNFMYGNASLSYYNSETRQVLNDIFYKQNGVPLGDVAESAVIHDGELYVVLNNSGKIMVMNFGKYPALNAFEFTHKITGLQSPRYINFIDSSKAYISDLYAKSISTLDPASYTVTGKINLANGNPDFYQHPTENIIVFGDEVFTNCYSFDNKILVIDRINDRLVDSIEVLQQPNSMVLDKNNKIWVLCDGGYSGSIYGDTNPGLVRIDAETRTVEKIFILPQDKWPSKLCINRRSDTLYFINEDIWRMPVNETSLPEKPFIRAVSGTQTRLFYGLGIDPHNSEVYVADAIDHVQSGVVYRYTAEGAGIDTFQVGIIPGFFCFIPVNEKDK
jgi:DNA-binding beta-propeller fold protein YncE